MRLNKIMVFFVLIIIVLIGIIYNLISITILNNQKLTLKEMSEIEYETYISSLKKSYEDYANYIEESKQKIASSITEMGVTTSGEETLEIMANNIKRITKDTSSDTLTLNRICLPVLVQSPSYTTVAEVLYNVQVYNKLSTTGLANNCSGKIGIYGYNSDGSTT